MTVVTVCQVLLAATGHGWRRPHHPGPPEIGALWRSQRPMRTPLVHHDRTSQRESAAVLQGREHATTTARADPDPLAQITDWISDGALARADLGYEGEPETFTIPFKKPKDGQPTIGEHAYNAPQRTALPGRTRQLAAQDHLQGPAPLQAILGAGTGGYRCLGRGDVGKPDPYACCASRTGSNAPDPTHGTGR